MDLSIIICTRNRADMIIGCLNSVAAALQRAQPVLAEIVIVDNGSVDQTSSLIREWIKHAHFPAKSHYEGRKGLAIARNSGIKASQYSLLLFTDDDCRLSEDYIKKAITLYERDRDLVMRGGRVELGDPTDMPFSIRTSKVFRRWKKSEAHYRYDLNNALIGASMIIPRELINEVGFFDERFGAGGTFPGGEEIDYLYRVYLKNYSIEYNPDLVVYHFHGRKTIQAVHALVCSYDKGDGALYAKFWLKDLNILRPFYWDIKKAILEFFGGPMSRPTLNISHLTRIRNVLAGIFDYCRYAFLYRIISRVRKE